MSGYAALTRPTPALAAAVIGEPTRQTNLGGPLVDIAKRPQPSPAPSLSDKNSISSRTAWGM
ncbi:hypothetical protein ZRA01_00430 [Zoogloea ramigera]|uniref:Uncharacterized protein n=1 Tax=Zoogloea ramigera TaxID=350 RepID=A0A4Y4CTQ4_ZOORA|nr:hypothetical protein ZRA01_00430 [Zoogloea ramigera]